MFPMTHVILLVLWKVIVERPDTTASINKSNVLIISIGQLAAYYRSSGGNFEACDRFIVRCSSNKTPLLAAKANFKPVENIY